jgi:thiamine biosynthesis lipoprotein
VEQYAFHGGKSSIRCRGNQELLDAKIGWSIAVRHPEQSERLLGSLRLFDQSLGTSGPANQFFYFKGKRFGHIIDPRTGWPAEGMLSVTVLHPQAGWADALATGLYVMGIDRAITYCENNPDTAMLAILPGERSGQVEIVACNLHPEQWMPA